MASKSLRSFFLSFADIHGGRRIKYEFLLGRFISFVLTDSLTDYQLDERLSLLIKRAMKINLFVSVFGCGSFHVKYG